MLMHFNTVDQIEKEMQEFKNLFTEKTIFMRTTEHSGKIDYYAFDDEKDFFNQACHCDPRDHRAPRLETAGRTYELEGLGDFDPDDEDYRTYDQWLEMYELPAGTPKDAMLAFAPCTQSGPFVFKGNYKELSFDYFAHDMRGADIYHSFEELKENEK